ncbi:6023_t:CDS:10 [Diversispora eburnea]|uniref:Midasin n=1 Tax=Diversispora eburnea TaxID=1213867 RepID=A0A9N8WIJ4_9GLOM|nr:6023_t:CDS:10 [Diversispora eburnea]
MFKSVEKLIELLRGQEDLYLDENDLNILLQKKVTQDMLNCISKLLLHPSLTLSISEIFRPILIDLVSRWLHSNIYESADSATFQMERVALAISKLLPTSPQLIDIAVTFFSQSPSLLSRFDSFNQSNIADENKRKDLKCLLIIAYRFLRFSRDTFSNLWNWSSLFQLLVHPDKSIRYLTVSCLSIVFNMSDFHKENSYLIWVESDLSDSTVNISGVLLPISIQSINLDHYKNKQRLIITDTTQKNLNAICLAISMRSPVLLEGVTGSGKTTLVEEIAIATGHYEDFLKIHVGDQTDSKVLLGTYVSTSTPALFNWQPGVLTNAVREGRWVLIEDIDLAPPDVISILLPLLETNHLFIPSRGERIKAKQGFQLFATKRLLPERENNHTKDKNFSSTLWNKIKIHPLSSDELAHVIEKRFPRLCELVSELMNVYKTLISIYQDSTLFSLNVARYISPRDLMKWLREEIFNEAADCFCAMLPCYSVWIHVLKLLGEAIGITNQWVEHKINSFTPNIRISDNSITIGRAQLSLMKKKKDIKSDVIGMRKNPFAKTGHALRLLEQISVCVQLCEPVLLVGETGTGKTSMVQHLADILNQNLVVVNLSQHSDSSDLLGGFKPVDAKFLAAPLKEDFDKLFEKTFSMRRNTHFLKSVYKMYTEKKYNKFITLLKQAINLAEQKFNPEQIQHLERDFINNEEDKEVDNQQNTARKSANPELRNRWKLFEKSVKEFEIQQEQVRNKFVFTFVEGILVKAVTKGEWILLDEINLASTETLECLSSLLQDSEGSLLLTEKGDSKPVKRHPNFRIFACMNPATDVGKRDLPPGLRSRFSEFYVHPSDNNRDHLLAITKQYLAGYVHGDDRARSDIVEFYLSVKDLVRQHKLVDGSNQKPHFSMRTLTRALCFVSQISPTYGLRRSMYEGFCMTFMTQLNKEGELIMQDLLQKHLLSTIKNPKSFLKQIPRKPSDKHIQFGQFWLKMGEYSSKEISNYIITPSVKKNLENLSRVAVSNKFPVLLQGPTSAGKTSIIHYLAQFTGHRFVRINNHEHTDLQEYLGSYVSNPEGKLEFQEGILVKSLRNGYWLVLDELNLAPTDVLEALNRLLDDNRELLIPETQEVIKPHPDFMLFATQNPPGLYAGRKVLSRAFRNRFIELHFNDIPGNELETILSERCKIAPSYCKRLIQVYKQLMERRQGTRVFEQKHGFITLRDLFRWAERGAIGYQELAEHGYMILAERVRKQDEKLIVKQVLENVMKVTIDENKMYDCSRLVEFQKCPQNDIVWTKAMKRLFTLVVQCLRFNEPVLLVGDTGSGKTTVCQILAKSKEKELIIVNCHHSTETADLLGGQRPLRNRGSLSAELKRDLIRYLGKYDLSNCQNLEELDLYRLIELFNHFFNKSKAILSSNLTENNELISLSLRCKHVSTLFEWHDGPLIQAMKNGSLFLLDEISLADDSVIERLNSVLEPHRILVLPEKGGEHINELVAKEGFQFLATMNPGGDYGKKELSPALRNRFTEIWVPTVTDHDDLLQIIDANLINFTLKGYGRKMLDFIDWFTHMFRIQHMIISIRDILSWVQFMNDTVDQLGAKEAFIHGGSLMFLDGFGSSATSLAFVTRQSLEDIRIKCLNKLKELIEEGDMIEDDVNLPNVRSIETHFGIHPFFILRGPLGVQDISFNLQTPITAENCFRILRAMQVRKSILLEGSPGVGKTSLITALANASGNKLVRINLSDQTDLMDLFGSDLPVEGGLSGEFAWRDAPFLKAMQNGEWVLLDELNLASQSVLEGLNSCLDHRGAVYIPELDKEFYCAPGFRVFGAQNPAHQGGGRKGLPKSFINRFTQVYIEQLTKMDMLYICKNTFSQISEEILEKMLEFNSRIYEDIMINCLYGRNGAPWEFNLRDVFRWLELLNKDFERGICSSPDQYLDLVYLLRMRTSHDRERIISTFNEIFNQNFSYPNNPSYYVTPNYLQVGYSILGRHNSGSCQTSIKSLHILQSHLFPLQSLMKCVELNWMVILTGTESTGKTSLVRLLADLTGHKLEEFSMNSSIDTIELLGGFEQVDLSRHRQFIINELLDLTNDVSKLLLTNFQIEHNNSFEKDDVLQIITQLNHLIFTLRNHHKFNNCSNSSVIDFDLTNQLLKMIDQTICHFKLPLKDSLQSLSKKITEFRYIENETTAGRFEWVDGVLINALQKGYWILIDNANLCNPSILDRLNPLLEPNGFLMVNEQGLIDGKPKIVYPHKNFRLFMTVDPKNGELSRAMRNRGVEIALLENYSSSNVQDLIKLANGFGLLFPRLHELFEDFAKIYKNSLKKNKNHPNLREYIMFIRCLNERIQRGESFLSAMQKIFRHSFESEENLSLDTKFSGFPADSYLLDFPFFAGGDMFRDESVLAMISTQGSYLLYLLHKNSFAKAESATNISRKLLIAIDYFVEMMSPEDCIIRQRWLDFVSSVLQSYFMMDGEQISIEYTHFLLSSLLKHPLAHQILEHRSKLVQSINLDLSCISDQSLDLSNNPYLYKLFSGFNITSFKNDNIEKIRLLWNEYSMDIKTFSILKRLKRLEYFENYSYKNVSQLSVKKMTQAQQSYSYDKGLLYESQLSHHIVGNFYPLLHKSLQFVNDLIDFRKFSDLNDFEMINNLLDQRDFLWNSLQNKVLVLGEIYIGVKFLSEATKTLFKKYCEIAQPLVDILEVILKDTSLNTGIFMDLLWKNFHHITFNKMELFLLKKELNSVATKIDPSIHNKESEELKNMVIDGIASLYFIDENSQNRTDELLHSIQKIPESPSFVQSCEFSCPEIFDPINCTLDYWSIIKEMQIIRQLQSIVALNFDLKNSIIIHQLSAWRDWSLKYSSRSPLDFVPHQQILWNYGIFSNAPVNKPKFVLNNMIQDVIYGWHNRLWNNNFKNIHIGEDSMDSVNAGNCPEYTEGPTKLFQSFFSGCYFNYSRSLQSTSFGNYDACLTRLKEFEELSVKDVTSKICRRNADISCLVLQFRQILHPFEYLFPSDIWNEICKKFNNIAGIISFSSEIAIDQVAIAIKSLNSLSIDLKQARDVFLLSILERRFIPIICFLIQILEKYNKCAENKQFSILIGKSWTFLALGFISLYIPNYPLDPAAETHARCKQLLHKQSDLETEIHVRSNIEQHITGNSDNIKIPCLRKNLENIRLLYENESTDLVIRPENSQINDIFKHIHYICGNVIDEKHVTALMEDLEKGCDTSVLRREVLFQENVFQFIQRMNSNYPLYLDLLRPMFIALFQLKYGIRLMSSASQYLNSALEISVYNIFKSLMSMTKMGYPKREVKLISSSESIRKIKGLIFSTCSTHEKWDIYLKYMITVIKCIYHHIAKRGHLIFEDLETIDIIFNEIADIYSAAEEHKKNLAQEDESLYKNKTKTHVTITDEQHIDNRFQLMSQNFWSLFTMARKLTSLCGKLYPEEFDETFTTIQLLCTSMLKNWLEQGAELEGSSVASFKNDGIYDFYKDENIIEARKISSVVANFKRRIKELLKLWPEHAVLHQLCNICDRINGFKLNSPIAKLLTGLEILLQKSEDWESYASRDVSLKSNQEEITDLIIKWRKLELECWPKLLKAQDKYYEQFAHKWWFHLYECIIRPIHKFIHQSSNNKDITLLYENHITEIVKILDQFIQSSNFGEFESRLELIHTFYLHLSAKYHFNKMNTQGSLYNHAADALWNVYKYYSQFLDEMRNTLVNQYKPIEKELYQFVKIASWKDTNIYALKQSAQKTHRHLSKCIRKYKDILNRPISFVITEYQDHLTIQSKEKVRDNHVNNELLHLPEKWLVDILPIDFSERTFELMSKQILTVPDRFININKTLQKFKSYCLKDIFNNNTIFNSHLDDFASEIILRIKTFQDETVPFMNEENKSFVKNMKLVKKKSLVDLLKELKRLGLHTFPNKKLVENQQNLGGYLLKLPRIQIELTLFKGQLLTEIGFFSIYEKADNYYFRIIARINNLRHASANYSKDLSSQEVCKALGFTEDLLSLLIQERQYFIEFEKHYEGLSGVVIQLDTIYSAYKSFSDNKSRNVVLLNSLYENRLKIVKEMFDDILCMLIHSSAIFDIQKQFSQQNTENIVQDIQNWLNTISSARQEIIRIFDRTILMSKYTIGKKAFLTTDAIDTLENSVNTLNEFLENLNHVCALLPSFAHIFSPICDYINSRIGNLESLNINNNTTNLDDSTMMILGQLLHKVNDLLDDLLVVVQNLKKSLQENGTAEVSEIDQSGSPSSMCDNNIRLEHEFILNIGKKLQVKSIIDRFNQIHSLVRFCIPEMKENGENGENGENLENLQGTGIGEGEGFKDVKQIGQFNDNESDVVDEKMWGDDSSDKEDTEKSSNKQESSSKSEIVAKDDSNENLDDKAQKPQTPKQGEQDVQDEQDEIHKNETEESLEQLDEHNEQQDNFNVDIPQAETLELPDDMEIDDIEDNDMGDGDDDLPSNMDLDNLDQEIEQEESQDDTTTGQDDLNSFNELMETDELNEDSDSINNTFPDNEQKEEQISVDNVDESIEQHGSQQNSYDQKDSDSINNTCPDNEQKEEQISINNDANPRRSLGDALEKWRRRLEIVNEHDNTDPEISQAKEKQEINIQDYDNDKQTFEYTKNDDMEHDLQIMEGANDEQSRNFCDIDNGDDHNYEFNHMPEEIDENIIDRQEDEPMYIENFHDSEDQKDGKDGKDGRELWQKYENLTYDLANGLCEQLRLILEPTLATRLKGDYRTGKRLNMKKIIPYIASDFRKDKIWLRRTRPSKRQYQVMIAVDDSKSMCQTDSIQLAYETLALISKALSQLEVGDISIVSFGEKVQILHPFDQPFSSEAGAQVLQQFTFEQNKTYVRNLMETSIALLEHARTNYSSRSQQKELWQLQLIISDGVCEDHESLKVLVRKAVEAQIMVVFIVVDNKSEKDSIMSMNQVKYKSVDGIMTLEMVQYLESFPFDYYVILKDINALSETLADVLRQYFSIISQNDF